MDSDVSNFSSGYHCLFLGANSSAFVACSVIYVLILLPLCSVVLLLLCLKQWRISSSSTSSSSPAAMSHSDCFTCHLALMQLLGFVPGYALQVWAVYRQHSWLLTVGAYMVSFSWYGEVYIHVLSCLERYLAVVRPVAYLGLKSKRGARVRNAAIGGVWLICLAETFLMLLPQFNSLDVCLLIISLATVSFCSLSVLHVLVHPGPGEPGGNGLHRTKQRAFHYIVTILGLLVLRFTGGLIWAFSSALDTEICMILACEIVYNLPSNLVLSLLFLHREGKLVCARKNTN
ncbi:unnamed protein product [Ophioblennius macclurei]